MAHPAFCEACGGYLAALDEVHEGLCRACQWARDWQTSRDFTAAQIVQRRDERQQRR